MTSGAKLTLALILVDEANAEGKRRQQERQRAEEQVRQQKLRSEEQARQEARRQRLERGQRIRSTIVWALFFAAVSVPLRASFVSFVREVVVVDRALYSGLNAYLLFTVSVALLLVGRYPHWSQPRIGELARLVVWSVFILAPITAIAAGFIADGLGGRESQVPQVPLYGWTWTGLWALGGAVLRASGRRETGYSDVGVFSDGRTWGMLAVVSLSLGLLMSVLVDSDRAPQALATSGSQQGAAVEHEVDAGDPGTASVAPSESVTRLDSESSPMQSAPGTTRPQETAETVVTTVEPQTWVGGWQPPYWDARTCPPDRVSGFSGLLCPGDEATATLAFWVSPEPAHNVTVEVVVPDEFVSLREPAGVLQLGTVADQAEVTFTLAARTDGDPDRLPPECDPLSFEDACASPYTEGEAHMYGYFPLEFVVRGDNLEEYRITEQITVAVPVDTP